MRMCTSKSVASLGIHSWTVRTFKGQVHLVPKVVQIMRHVSASLAKRGQVCDRTSNTVFIHHFTHWVHCCFLLCYNCFWPICDMKCDVSNVQCIASDKDQRQAALPVGNGNRVNRQFLLG